jgi:arsenate reductase
MKPTILILCTGNSCRSHIGEGFLRAALGDRANVQSAGSKPADYVHPLAIKVMAEVGIDISAHNPSPPSSPSAATPTKPVRFFPDN